MGQMGDEVDASPLKFKKQKIELLEVFTNGEVTRHPPGIKVQNVLEAGNGLNGAVAARLDNEVVPLSKSILGTSVRLEPVPLASPDGIRTLVETLKFLLKIAKQEVAPQIALTFGRSIGAAYYCEFANAKTQEKHIPSDEDITKLQGKIFRLIEAGLDMEYKQVSTSHALSTMRQTGFGLTATILDDMNKPSIEVVECRDMFHVACVPILPNTSMVPRDSFKLSRFKDGIVLEHFRFDKRSGSAIHIPPSPQVNDMLFNAYVARRQWGRDVGFYTVAQLNKQIKEGHQKKVIQAAEANCDRQFVEIAAAIQAKAETKLVLIAGPSSSGKTTFAKRLQVQLESLGIKPEVLSVDSFYRPWQDINPEGPHKVDWESLDALNLKQLNDVLLTLLAGDKAVIPEYDMKVSMPADKSTWGTMQLSPGRSVIIMEGIHCLNPTLTAAVPKNQKFQIAIAPVPALQLDGSHVLSGTTIRMFRRMIRDYLNRGRPVLTTLRQWPSVAAGEQYNIYPNQIHADAFMNSELAYEMSVLKVHVEPLLKTIKSTEPEYSEVRRLLNTLNQFIALPTNIIPPQSLLREFVGGSWYYDFGGWYKNF